MKIAKILCFISLIYGPAVAAATDEMDKDLIRMEYVSVCDNTNPCMNFSKLVMGTDHLVQADWNEKGQPEIDEVALYEILDEAVKLGINVFDTAPIYVGGIEQKLGKWLESRKEKILRDDFYYNINLNPDRKIYILSKGGFPFDLYWAKKLDSGSNELVDKLKQQGILGAMLPGGGVALENVPPGTYASRLFGAKEQIMERVGEELKHTLNNLGQNIPTIYLMHRDDHDYLAFKEIKRKQTPVKTILEALSDPNLASNYRMIGWSNWRSPRINESIDLANTHRGLLKPMFNSAYFSLFEMTDRTIHVGGVQVTHDEMQDESFQQGIRQMPYSPLGGFSILDKAEPKWENAKRAAKEKFDLGDPYWQNVYHSIFTDANHKRYERVKRFAKHWNSAHQANFTLDQFVNAYALAHKRTDMLAIGPVNIDQLRRTVLSLNLANLLTETDLQFLYSGTK